MNALYYYAAGFIIIWIIGICLRNKSYVSIEGAVLMFKTGKLGDVIDKIALCAPLFWRRLMNVLIPPGLFIIVLMTGMIIYSVTVMYNQPTVSLILPGVDIPGSPLYIPFTSGIIALATVMIVHEGGHGILARAENISIDSVGLLLFAVIPGAFVEPDQEELDKAAGISKIRVYLAGPMANIMVCFIALIITVCISSFIVGANFYVTDGMQITSVVPDSPAGGILSDDMTIIKLNNQTINSTGTYTAVTNNTHPGEVMNITTDKGSYNLTLGVNPMNSSRGYIGIRCRQNKVVSDAAREKYGILPDLLPFLEELFYMIFLLNFSVGTFNLLPMKPLDGGLIVEQILRTRITPERRAVFNNTLDKYTKYLPGCVRRRISGIFNTILNIICAHPIKEERTEVFMRMISTFFIVIIIMLLLYGTIPNIMKLL